MCVLLIGWQLRDDTPLVVAANRDEARARASQPPAVVTLGRRRALLPRDRVAGGTWLGVNDAGVAVAITNRPDGSFDPTRPSRGDLPLQSLALDSAATARTRLETRTAQEPFNSFNLLVADRQQAWVARWNGRLRITELQPGAFVLTNSHDLDELPVPEFASLPWRSATLPALWISLRHLLGDHRGRDGQGYPLCKHGDDYGTVSAAVFAEDPADGWQMDFADGNPCTTPFVRYPLGRRTTRPEDEPRPEV